MILKFDLLGFFFFSSVLAQEIFCKCASKDELSPISEADGRELCHVCGSPLPLPRPGEVPGWEGPVRLASYRQGSH